MNTSELLANTLQFYHDWPNYIFYYLEISYVCVLLFHNGPFRRMAKLRVPLCIVCFIATTFLLDGILKYVAPHFMWVINYGLCVLWASLCIKGTQSYIYLYTACGFALQNFASALDKFLFGRFTGRIQLWLFFLCSIALFTLFYFAVIQCLHNVKNLEIGIDRFFVILVLLLVVSQLDSLLDKGSWENALLAMAVQCGIDAFIIVYLLYSAQRSELLTLRNQLENYMEMDAQRYKQLQQDMEVLNIRYHDFKQYIRMCEQKKVIDRETSEEMLTALADINSMPCCGNHTLDLILSDKVYLCRHKKIRFTYTIDSTGLYGLSDTDIVSLFNNILYNAIEYLSRLSDTEKRLLDLKVICKNNFLIIHCENYCEDTLSMEDDLPKTTKADSVSHGYGLKSVRYIVKKHGGELTITNKDRQLAVNIIIPITKP